MARQSGVIDGQTAEGQQTEEIDQSRYDAAGVIDGTWEDWNDYGDWYDDQDHWYDWTGALYDDSWGYDDWNACDYWSEDWLPDRETTEEHQGPPLETSAIIPSLGQPLIEEIDEESEAVSAALPSQSASSGGRTRPPKPGLFSKLFVGALMLIGTLSSNVPVCQPSDDIERSAQPPALPDPKDPLAEFHFEPGGGITALPVTYMPVRVHHLS